MRTLLVFGLAAGLLAIGGAGCAMQTDDDVGKVEAAATGGKPCASSSECPNVMYCTTEDGVCDPPPGCQSGDACLSVCYGTCQVDNREECGDVVCPAGQVCCNASCGICTEPGGVCTQQICE